VEAKILGADSFGVRSLATFVTTSSMRIFIDPGVSVCPKRDGHPPHRLELEELNKVRAAIQEHARIADAIVITHFHHDHFTSFEDRPLDLTNPETAQAVYGDKPVYVKAWQRKLNHAQKTRAIEFVRSLGRRVTIADGGTFGGMTFSPPFKHGEAGSKQGWVTMVMLEDRNGRLVFGSDIQLIEHESVDWIIERKPDILIVSGPPVYLRVLAEDAKQRAHANLLRLTEAIGTIVIDHHLLRTREYHMFLAEPLRVARNAGHCILTAADFMGRQNALLEARRKELWQSTPSPFPSPRGGEGKEKETSQSGYRPHRSEDATGMQ
jgi:predicted metallo-beta-lactamase superfamily hydrolase